MFFAWIRYRFDSLMSRGLLPVVFLLLIVSCIIIFIFTVVAVVAGIEADGSGTPFIELFWMSLMRTLDPGTMGEDQGWGRRILMLLVTLYGVVMLSTFIGLISNGIMSQLQLLRKGRSKVLERGHMLILGWSSKIPIILNELIIANENQKDPVIVILANEDKVKMDDEIREKVADTENTRIVTRSGNPMDVNDLDRVNPQQTKSIIILGGENENSDAKIIKVILAILNNPRERMKPYHITAEIREEKNLEVARMVGKGQVELILSDDLTSRIMVQSSRQSGLTVVYSDFFDFAGDEIYFHEESLLHGKTFREALFSYEKSALIGFQEPGGDIVINPPASYQIAQGAKVIVISEDDDTVIMSGKGDYDIREERIITNEEDLPKNRKILLLGWNTRAPLILDELCEYLEKGGELTIISDYDLPDDVLDRLRKDNPSHIFHHRKGVISNKETLMELHLEQFDHIVLLSYEQHLEIQEADSKTLITLLHLRNIAENGNFKLNIVSEMLDMRNRELAKVTDANDFIVSDNIISMVLCQVAENKHLMKVFDYLFQADGSEVYIKPIVNYVDVSVPLTFYTLLESALRKKEVAIGYRLAAEQRNEKKNYGIVLNPLKSEKVAFGPEDSLIVLAED